jgi:ATP-dependent DNA helicase RecQ
VACTATASAAVQQDIQNCLRMKDPLCIRMPVAKNNLQLCIASKGNKGEAERSLARLVKRSSSKTVIVFCYTRDECEKVADVLRKNSITAEAYHSHVEDRAVVEGRAKRGVRKHLILRDRFLPPLVAQWRVQW